MAICYPIHPSCGPCGQVTTPLVYDESLSVAQQIACILGQVKKLKSEGVTSEELASVVDQINEDQGEQTSCLKRYTDSAIDDLDYTLRRLIVQHQTGMMLWDVTSGMWDENIQTMRDLFNDITIHSVTVDQLSELPLTVEGLSESGLNVRGLAVYSGWLKGATVPEGVFYTGPDVPSDGALTCAVLAKGMVADGHFVAEGECGDAQTCARLTADILANGEVEDGHMVEGDDE